MSTTVAIKDQLNDFLQFSPVILQRKLTKEEFIELSSRFPQLQMERESNGKVIVMSPVKKGSGKIESLLITFIGMWVLKTRLGESYSSSTGIELSDGAVKSPDCSWISEGRLALLPDNADDKFLQAMPDFAAEVRSSLDSLPKLKKKMEEVWMTNGVRLGWLIDPSAEKVWIYRENREVEEVVDFTNTILSGEEIMPGMELPLAELKLKK